METTGGRIELLETARQLGVDPWELSDVSSGGAWCSKPEAIDLVLVLDDVREYLEAGPTWTTLVGDVGDEEARLPDKLER